MNTVMEQDNNLVIDGIQEEEESYQYYDYGVEQEMLQPSVQRNTKFVPMPDEPSVPNTLLGKYEFNNTQNLTNQEIVQQSDSEKIPPQQFRPRQNIVIIPPPQDPHGNEQLVPESPEKTKRPPKPKKTYLDQKIDQNKTQQRNGTNHQSPTQKVVKKVSLYHYSKNYRQQRDRLAKKIYRQTGQLMTVQSFKQKLQNYKPKPSKKSTFVNRFENEDEKQLVLIIYHKSIRKVFLIMFESQVRRNLHMNIIPQIPQNQQQMQIASNSSESGSQEQENKEEFALKCLDDDGNKELLNSFESVFNESVAELLKEIERKGTQISFSISEFRQKLIKSLK